MAIPDFKVIQGHVFWG